MFCEITGNQNKKSTENKKQEDQVSKAGRKFDLVWHFFRVNIAIQWCLKISVCHERLEKMEDKLIRAEKYCLVICRALFGKMFHTKNLQIKWTELEWKRQNKRLSPRKAWLLKLGGKVSLNQEVRLKSIELCDPSITTSNEIPHLAPWSSL